MASERPLPATLGEALALAHARIDRLDARVLLREAAEVSTATLAAFPERALSSEAAARFVDWVERREAGEPVAYLVGEREFFGRLFRVSPATLIPRPDTELIVERTLEAMEGVATPHILDLGTGSGVIATTLAVERPDAVVSATDFSPAALEIAQANALAHGGRVRFLSGSWFQPVPEERFHCIVSNPPYIAEGDPHLSQGDLRFEPLTALSAGADGLDDIRHIISEAPTRLHPKGWLLIEHGYDQAQAVRDLLDAHGFTHIDSWRDLSDIERVSGGMLN